ncbi:MAG: hypothetical protein K2X69_01615 [Silvanigrellaceae bacterium]|nr:hypothetical protein [Silvanigrellaceae bacterium]
MAISVKYKTFGSLEQFLRRKKIENSGKLANFLLSAFIESPLEKRDGEFILLFRHDFERAGLITDDQNFDELREKLILKGVLVWRVKPNDPNFIQKKNYFSASTGVLNYINKEKLSRSTLATMEDVDNKVNSIEKALKSEVEELRIELRETNRKIEKVAEYVLHQNPPDTPERKQIVVDNIDNIPKALELLAQQRKLVDKNIQETGKMFN